MHNIDIYELFNYYTKNSLKTGDNLLYCNECQKQFDDEYGANIYSVPNYLIIFLYNERGAIYQINTKFLFF